jgi:hypothetical protein
MSLLDHPLSPNSDMEYTVLRIQSWQTKVKANPLLSYREIGPQFLTLTDAGTDAELLKIDEYLRAFSQRYACSSCCTG